MQVGMALIPQLARTKEARGSNPLTSTPHNSPCSPAWRRPSAKPAPFQSPLPGSKRAATANATAPAAGSRPR
jgi:hypothetical protein